ncbi:MAG: TIGR01777 family protein [Opitutus sp.]|nr:TIGR01777 family protein [Opitutus sp.]
MILAGGTGFIGTALAHRLRERGHEVVVLTRRPPQRRSDGAREAQWDGRVAGPWAAELEEAGGVINLAGSTINTVHNAENRRRILESRVDPVRALGAAVRACRQPPAVWVQTSAVGIYGQGDGCCTEDTPAGEGFMPEVCVRWEQAFREECPAALRAVVLRVGVVLGRRGGAYPLLARVTKLFLGGAAGDGRQGISWILLDDLEEIFLRAVESDAMRGVYNACAPEPASNAEFMRALRASLGRPWAPPAPTFLIRRVAPLVMRTDASLVLQGQHAVPARLEAEGFRFRARRIEPALRALAG